MAATVATGWHILLVEDDESNALTLAALLEDLGCTVDIAASLAAARGQLGRARYAMVLLDRYLGDGTGPELLPLLQQTHACTPVVLLSGSVEPLASLQGITATHTKGADPEKLLHTVRRLLP